MGITSDNKLTFAIYFGTVLVYPGPFRRDVLSHCTCAHFHVCIKAFRSLIDQDQDMCLIKIMCLFSYYYYTDSCHHQVEVTVTSILIYLQGYTYKYETQLKKLAIFFQKNLFKEWMKFVALLTKKKHLRNNEKIMPRTFL